MDGSTNGGYPAFTEIRLSKEHGKNLVKNKKATASSQEYYNKVEYGNDGSMNTRWCARSLGQKYKILHLTYYM